MNYITELFNHYGYIVLFIALMLELIALPTPGETLMIYCGYLVYQGRLNWAVSILVAAAGVITGITISYYIGKLLDERFIDRYGARVHFGRKEYENVSKWFHKYGNGLLIVAYFIPGIRHFSGYFTGITRKPYKQFAINSYIGAFLWTGSFISLGKILGPDWEQFHTSIMKYTVIGGVLIGVILIGTYLYKSDKQQLAVSVKKALDYSLKILHSLGKVRIAVVGTALVFLGLMVLTAGLIQDFLANEFGKFDTVTAYVINQMFDSSWSDKFRFLHYLTSIPVILSLTALNLVWIMYKGKNRLLEIRFLIITILGGEVLEELLRVIFHQLAPFDNSAIFHTQNTFPSEQTLMVIVTYGTTAFLLLRHIKNIWLKNIIIPVTIVISLFTGISPVYLNVQYPSDVTAGYVFGGAWLSINIVLLEIFRILPEIDRVKE